MPGDRNVSHEYASAQDALGGFAGIKSIQTTWSGSVVNIYRKESMALTEFLKTLER